MFIASSHVASGTRDGQIEIRRKGVLFREIGKFAIHLDAAVPVPLPDGGKLRPPRPRADGAEQFRIDERIKSAPGERRLRQPAIGAMHIEPDRPELVVMALAELEFRHPIKNFARIEIAKNTALEFEQERRMHRVGKIEQNVRRRPAERAARAGKFRCSASRSRSCCLARRILVEQAITSGASPWARSCRWKLAMQSRVVRAVLRRGQQFEPDRILLQSAQAEHPLERHGKIAAAFAILRRKSAPEENRHGGIIGGKLS